MRLSGWFWVCQAAKISASTRYAAWRREGRSDRAETGAGTVTRIKNPPGKASPAHPAIPGREARKATTTPQLIFASTVVASTRSPALGWGGALGHRPVGAL